MKINLKSKLNGLNSSFKLMFMLFLFFLSQNLIAQNPVISFSTKNVTVKNIFSEIEKQTKMSVDYDESILKDSRVVNLSSTSGKLSDILNQALYTSGCTFIIKNGLIVIVVQNKVQKKSVTIAGQVTDESGQPIIGANVQVKGTTQGTITDINGNYSFEVSPNSNIQVSSIGYTKKVVAIGDQRRINISLVEDTKKLDEVVVVGYGTMKKRDLTGAVSSVKMSDAPVSTISTVSHALAGKAAGLQVNTISAQPGGGANFRIRGAASSSVAGNDPLIIIDGFPVSDPGSVQVGKYEDGVKDNILASINPNDIESIEVLKDASSTAIYGARAGNGVIIVTTKRGKSGAPIVKYSATVSVQQMANKYDMLNATDFMTESNRYQKEDWMRVNKVGIYGGKAEGEITKPFTPRYSNAEIQNPANQTDWFDEITRLGYQTQHNISMNGGTENTQYLISGNFFKQNGVVKNNELDRYTGRVNLDQRINKYFKAGVNFTISRNAYDNVPLGSGQSENASIMVAASQFNPILAIKNANGEYILNSEAAFLPNPISLLEITDKTIKERLLGTAFIEMEPIKNLKLKANFGIDRNYQKRETYLPRTTLYGLKEGGKASIGQADNSDYLMELTASYTKTIKNHSLTLLAGHSYQIFDATSLGLGNNNFLIDGFLYNNIGAGAAPKPSVDSYAEKNRMASFFGRVNYSYLDRYLLTATLRADGASNFAKNNRWGYFPSVALGWRFLDEDFMKPVQNVLSNGKLRISYGETGNSNIGNGAVSYYQVGNNNTFGDAEYKGVYLNRLGNPDLKWETTREWNFGIDLGFIDNRINITAEYFKKVVSDLLNERPLLSYHEVGSVAANVGKTQSTGFELTVNTQNIKSKDFTWNTDFTFSLYRDKWKERDPNWKPSAYSIYDAPLRGIGPVYGYLSDGLIQAGESIKHMPGSLPGQVKIKDIDGFQKDAAGKIMVDGTGKPLKTGTPDGKLDDADKVFYGKGDPGYLLGLNNNFRYKNFDLNIYFYGQLDKKTIGSYKDLWLTGANNMTGIVNLYRGYNMPVSAKEVWNSDNQSATRPGYFQDRSTYGIGDYYIQKSWFVRCRNITLGYNIPVNLGKKSFSNLRVYADVNNLFTITPYKGLDPETDNSVWAYPNVRSYSIGLDITF